MENGMKKKSKEGFKDGSQDTDLYKWKKGVTIHWSLNEYEVQVRPEGKELSLEVVGDNISDMWEDVGKTTGETSLELRGEVLVGNINLKFINVHYWGEQNEHSLTPLPQHICWELSKQPAKLTNSSTGKSRTDDTHLIIHLTNISLSSTLDKLRGLGKENAIWSWVLHTGNTN